MDLKKLLLEENVGGFDLMFRALMGVLGITALAMNLVKTSPWKWITALIAAVGLFTSITRHCSPYHLLGINTAKK
ncbi:YgaP family membrane protein [Methanosarcina sp. Mfa9]|uniref:YgaP family membrane protein n=1 Tax=Methanosarcina sp. Mfa9 TaxID=3439063 RepID=UPI003F867D81